MGNEQLTARTGLMLVVLLAVLGVTIVQIRQLIWLHLFLGLILFGPLAVKMGATGYRFVRYYAGSVRYRKKGPPDLPLRVLAPVVVISTIVVFASGVIVLFGGPRAPGAWLTVHKASFIAWLGATALHVLGHLPRLPRQVRGVGELGEPDGRLHGQTGRWILLVGSLIAGVVLALALVPDFAAWTAPGPAITTVAPAAGR